MPRKTSKTGAAPKGSRTGPRGAVFFSLDVSQFVF